MRVTRTVQIANDLGLHLRAAGVLVQVAGRFQADIKLSHDDMEVNAKSIMSVLSLAAAKGTEIVIAASGADAEEAVAAVYDTIRRGFVT
jgi:phosphocarrier protein